MRRLASHTAVVALVLTTLIGLPSVIPYVHAGKLDPPERERLLPSSEPVDLPRASVTTRGPAPFPTPVPVDPNATPLQPPPVAERGPVAPMIWPVGGTITQAFSAAHPALDIAAPCGTPLIAPASGTLVYAGWKNNGGGYVVDIDAGWGLVSLNHLSGIAPIGPTVTQGQVVGYVGATGLATGCHLHLAVAVDGAWRNPLQWLSP